METQNASSVSLQAKLTDEAKPTLPEIKEPEESDSATSSPASSLPPSVCPSFPPYFPVKPLFCSIGYFSSVLNIFLWGPFIKLTRAADAVQSTRLTVLISPYCCPQSFDRMSSETGGKSGTVEFETPNGKWEVWFRPRNVPLCGEHAWLSSSAQQRLRLCYRQSY